MRKTILITGCSSGIGAALAREFAKRGHRVYATARRVEALGAMEPDGIHSLALDVNDDASILDYSPLGIHCDDCGMLNQ